MLIIVKYAPKKKRSLLSAVAKKPFEETGFLLFCSFVLTLIRKNEFGLTFASAKNAFERKDFMAALGESFTCLLWMVGANWAGINNLQRRHSR